MSTATPPRPATPRRPAARSTPAAEPPAAPSVPASAAPSSVRLPALRHIAPNWYSAVMGTAIVASAGAALAGIVPGAGAGTEPGTTTAAPTAATSLILTAMWTLSAALLTTVLLARAAHWLHHRDRARAHLLDPAVAPFHGCAAMALTAVGAGALTAGRGLLGERAAVAVAAVLCAAGAVAGVVVAMGVPWLMFVRRRVAPGEATPVWLLPVVAPMVSAAALPLLAARLPGEGARQALLWVAGALFVTSLAATAAVLRLVFARLVRGGPLPLALTPSLFLVLGPLGQSTTALAHMAAVDAPAARPLASAAVLYGVPVLGFALLWLVWAGASAVRALRRGMPFTLGWWAFTFPVGTCVTGAAGLAQRTGGAVFTAVAVGLYALLAVAWAVAAAGTLRGLFGGALLAGPRR